MSSEINLAVLPFRSSGQKSSAVIENFEEDLVLHLSMFQGLSVLSYFSTMGLSLAEPERLEQYQVSHVVTGDFRTNDRQVNIGVQLIELPNHKIVFNQRMAFTEAEVFDTLDQTVLRITNALGEQLNQVILSHSYQRPEVELEAYELFLLGNAHLRNGTPEDDHTARAYFEKAIAKQPNFARAYSGISSSYFNEWSCQLWDRWEISQHGAKKFALKAIDLDENDYVSLSILGRVLLFERDFEQAEHYLRKSLRMNNNDPSVLIQLAFSFMFLGDNEQALALYERACRLNPVVEDRYLTVGATLLFENGAYAQTLEMGGKLEPDLTYIDFPVYLAAASYYLGQEAEAMVYWEQFLLKHRNHIYFESKGQAEKALDWHININPYRTESELKPFWDFIRARGGEGVVDATPQEGDAGAKRSWGRIVLGSAQVEVAYAGKTIHAKPTKGWRDLAALLSQPEQDIHCLELMGGHQEHSAGVAVLDETAKRAYRQKMLELQADITEAEANNDQVRTQSLTLEYEELMDHLSKSLGLDGQPRKVATSADKARAAVTLRIRDCIKKITASHPQLGAHLKNSVKTGMLCSYQPEGETHWEITRE